jgi:hypothetical protein
MLKQLKFPYIYIVEFLIWLPLLTGFAITASFLAARPIATINLQGKSLPTSWEAAVANHGRFLEGYLISSHPLAFCFGLALLAASIAVLYAVHKEQAFQRQSDGPSHRTAHMIANFAVGGALLIIGYFVFTNFLVGIEPT